MTNLLCSVCEGNGVVRIPGGISVCDHCNGRGYEPSKGPTMKTADEMQALIDQNLALALELKQTYEPTPPPDGTIINVSDAPDGARSYQVVPPYHPNICGR